LPSDQKDAEQAKGEHGKSHHDQLLQEFAPWTSLSDGHFNAKGGQIPLELWATIERGLKEIG